MFKSLLISALSLLLAGQLSSQHFVVLKSDTISVFPTEDAVQVNLFTNSWIARRIDEGYVQAGVLNEYKSNDSIWVTELYLGGRMHYSQLLFIHPNGDTLKWRQSILSKVKQLANEGYPFAKLKLSNINYQEADKLSLTYKIDEGPKIYFDSVAMTGNVPVRESVLYKLIDIYPGELYSEERFEAIQKKIATIEFIDSQSEPDVGFYADKASVYLNLKVLQRNSFDAMVGLLPNAQGATNRINGFVDFHLANLFRSAVSLDIDWKAFGTQSQSMSMGAKVPTVGRTGLGIDLEGSVLRQDSSFVTTSFGAHLLTDPSSNLRLKFGYIRNASTGLNTPNEDIEGFSYDWYSGSVCIACTNEADQSRLSGWSINGSASVGVRTIIDGDRLGENSLTFRASGSAFAKIPYGSQSLFQSVVGYSLLDNPDGLLENEKFRIGGLNTMRGFFENQFFTSQYLTFRNDFRFYLEEKSYFLGFIDGGFFETSSFNYYNSTGIGLSINTAAGILNLIFARGRILRDSSNINYLIHFGYSTIF